MADRQKKRFLIQAIFAFLTNSNIKGCINGNIYDRYLKYTCVPGLNCYSCPGALGACPLGALQSSLISRNHHYSFYVVGLIIFLGVIFGRIICGLLCPFGLIQDLLFKIPFVKKIKSVKAEKFLRGIRFFILIIFVITLPMFFIDITGLGKPWFCEFICPAGTLEGGIPLTLLNQNLRQAIGFLFKWKLFILAAILLLSVFIYRPFCRYFCPLGAIYGLLNKISFWQYKINQTKCTRCGLCQKTCELNINVFENPNSIDCIRCGKCKDICKNKAITYR